MTILVNGGMIFFADKLVQSQIDEALKSAQSSGRRVNYQALVEYRQSAVQGTRIADGIAIAAGIVFVIYALNVHAILFQSRYLAWYSTSALPRPTRSSILERLWPA